MTDEYEVERRASREEAATVLHGVADGVAAGAVRLGSGDEEHTVEIPDHVDLEVEFETEEGELSLEVELGWPEDAPEREERQADRPPDSQEEVEDVPPGEAGPADHLDTEEDVDERADQPTGERSEDPDESAVETTPAEIAKPAVGEAAQQVSLGRFELFEDKAGEWRWRLVHRNGNVIATSGEGYSRKHNARKGLRSVMRNAEGAEVTERPDE